MADRTKIEWAQATWNPVTGCTPVSEACEHCYASNLAKRFWKGRKFSEIRFHRDRLKQPYKWKKPRIIFVCSMGDLFHAAVAQTWIDEILQIVKDNHKHIFIFLTKRPHRMKFWLFPDNCWAGVTVELQSHHHRIDELLMVVAPVRFISVEPMLAAIDLKLCWRNNTGRWDATGKPLPLKKIDWVICGAETGPGARPLDLKWARDLRDQCRVTDTPFFFKKAGNRKAIPDDLMIREYPKCLKKI